MPTSTWDLVQVLIHIKSLFPSWYLSEEIKTLIRKDIRTLMFITALFTIATLWKCPSTDEWIKYIYVYTYIFCYIWNISHKINEILPFVTWMDLEAFMLSEISQRKTNTV